MAGAVVLAAVICAVVVFSIGSILDQTRNARNGQFFSTRNELTKRLQVILNDPQAVINSASHTLNNPLAPMSLKMCLTTGQPVDCNQAGDVDFYLFDSFGIVPNIPLVAGSTQPSLVPGLVHYDLLGKSCLVGEPNCYLIARAVYTVKCIPATGCQIKFNADVEIDPLITPPAGIVKLNRFAGRAVTSSAFKFLPLSVSHSNVVPVWDSNLNFQASSMTQSSVPSVDVGNPLHQVDSVIFGKLQMTGTSQQFQSWIPAILNGQVAVGNNCPQGNYTCLTVGDPSTPLTHADLTAAGTIYYQNFNIAQDTFVGQVAIAAGNVNIGDLTARRFYYTSDARLKKNVTPLSSASNIVGKIKGRLFEWKKSGSKSFGFIAQEVQKVEPELVRSSGDEIVQKNLLAVDYGALVPIVSQAFIERRSRAWEVLRAERDRMVALRMRLEQKKFSTCE